MDGTIGPILGKILRSEWHENAVEDFISKAFFALLKVLLLVVLRITRM